MHKIEKIKKMSIDSLNRGNLENYIQSGHKNYFNLPAGEEHYKLLSYLSTLIDNSIIFDIGTNKGSSAVSLSFNSSNKIISYDVVSLINEGQLKENITYKIGNAIEDDELLKSSVILLDTEHDGIFEKQVLDHLIDKNYKGVLLLDDIILNKEMIDFWNKIDLEKYDITHLGHCTGTGLVYFK